MADVFAAATVVELRTGRWINVLHHRVATPSVRILLCHGSMASMVQYRAMIEFAVGRKNVDILAYDWLGCGSSAKPRNWDAYSTANLLDDLEAAYRRLLLPDSAGAIDAGAAAEVAPLRQPPAVIVGHSFGTSLVTQLVADLTATAGSEPRALPPLTSPAALCLLAAGDGASTKGNLGVFYLPEFVLRLLQPTMTAAFAQMSLHPEASEAVKAEACAISAANDMHVCKAFYRQMSWRRAEVAAIVGPALVAHGDADRVLPQDEGRRAAGQLKRAVFHTVAQASHQLMMEQAEATNALLGLLLDNLIAGRDALDGLEGVPGK